MRLANPSPMANPIHEAPEGLGPDIVEMHHALVSLIEQLEAVDWYFQRVSASQDAALRKALVQSRDQEKQDACRTLEWIRVHDPKFDDYLRRYLFRPDSAHPLHEPGNGVEANLRESDGSTEIMLGQNQRSHRGSQ